MIKAFACTFTQHHKCTILEGIKNDIDRKIKKIGKERLDRLLLIYGSFCKFEIV